MSSPSEREAVAKAWMDMLNARDAALGDSLLAPDCVDHFHPGPPSVFLPFVEQMFPDFRFTTDDVFAGGDDRVVVRFTFDRTFQATASAINAGGIAIMRVVHGKIAEFWEYSDLPQKLAAASAGAGSGF